MKPKELSEKLTEEEIAQIIQLKNKDSLNKIIEELRNLREYEPFNLYFLEENKIIDLNMLYSICKKEIKIEDCHFNKEIINCLIETKLIEIKTNLLFSTDNLKYILSNLNNNYTKKRIELINYLKEQTKVKTKFKIGMKVKRIKSFDLNFIKKGDTATVIDISHDGLHLCVFHLKYGEYNTLSSDWDVL